MGTAGRSRKTNKRGVRRVKSSGMIADAVKYDNVYQSLWNDKTIKDKQDWLEKEEFAKAGYYAKQEWSDLKKHMRMRWRHNNNQVVRAMMV